jgi:hypothetical protein
LQLGGTQQAGAQLGGAQLGRQLTAEQQQADGWRYDREGMLASKGDGKGTPAPGGTAPSLGLGNGATPLGSSQGNQPLGGNQSPGISSLGLGNGTQGNQTLQPPPDAWLAYNANQQGGASASASSGGAGMVLPGQAAAVTPVTMVTPVATWHSEGGLGLLSKDNAFSQKGKDKNQGLKFHKTPFKGDSNVPLNHSLPLLNSTSNKKVFKENNIKKIIQYFEYFNKSTSTQARVPNP